ncbi:MAG: hypothetical protein ACI4XJ_11925 [Eubacteriales bacterium]
MRNAAIVRALVKKQFSMIFSSMFRTKKNTEKKSGAVTVVFALLMLYAAAAIGILFYLLMDMLAAPLNELGLGWLYFAYADVIALIFTLIVGIFSTQAQLYEAKDNELLLSLPIPPKYILFCRMLPLYLQSLLFSALILIPSYIAYAVNIGAGVSSTVVFALKLLIIPIFSLGLSCVIGWLTALAMSRVRRRNLVSIFLTVAFLVVYFVLYSRFMTYIQLLIVNSEKIGASFKKYLFLFYRLGLASEGDFVSAAVSFAVIFAFFALVYAVLSKTYISVITSKRGAEVKKYSGGSLKVGTVRSALLKKEFSRFTASSVYLLNCGIGTILLLLGAVMLIIKGKWLTEYAGSVMPALSDMLPLLLTLAVSLISSLNAVTASSISLEGKNLYIIRSLPVGPFEILKSKLTLHWLVTAPAAILCSAVFSAVLGAGAAVAVISTVLPAVTVLMYGEIGLLINLKYPVFNWDNETYPVKQSLSEGLALLSGFGINILFAGIYVLLKNIVPAELYLLACLAVISIVCAVLFALLRKNGVKLLESYC